MSDIHLGYHIRRNEFSKWIDMINGEKPDMVLIAGDIIDRSVAPLLADDDAKEFRRISAPVFACPGNHEYYSGIDNSKEFYKLAGITMLRDRCRHSFQKPTGTNSQYSLTTNRTPWKKPKSAALISNSAGTHTTGKYGLFH